MNKSFKTLRDKMSPERRKKNNKKIEYLVKKWHSNLQHIPLYEYLGMTQEEYALYVEKGILPIKFKE